MNQPSLFDLLEPPTVSTSVPVATKVPVSRRHVEPFSDWDESRMVPDPTWVPPVELALPTDDVNWQPGND
jgi:hypothetical protein